MSAYYNEWDSKTASWLRELIKQKLIAPGVVDERSITDVSPDDLKGFKQCHFFAGIGGWSYALRLAGLPDYFHCWTGSPPCQPFSIAGKQRGHLDERHLAPAFLRLIEKSQPSVVFGEQVSNAIRKHWLDDLFTELESQNYACGASVLPASSVGAPHKRDRLFFGAARLDHSSGFRWNTGRIRDYIRNDRFQPDTACQAGVMANNLCEGLQGRFPEPDDRGEEGWPDSLRSDSPCCLAGTEYRITGSNNGFWSLADWLRCKDGRFRSVEPRSFPLAHGVSSRVGRLRGYGNAIVPQVAAEFIHAFLSACEDTL